MSNELHLTSFKINLFSCTFMTFEMKIFVTVLINFGQISYKSLGSHHSKIDDLVYHENE